MNYVDALTKISEGHDTVTSRLLLLFVPYAVLSIWLGRKERATRLQAFNGVVREVEI